LSLFRNNIFKNILNILCNYSSYRKIYLFLQILGALGTENNRPSSAAQCVAYVAVAELAVGQWSELIPLLVNNVVNPSSTEMMKEATLETIGYICQEIESEVLVSQSNEILTAIIHGMKGSSTSNHVRLAATSALYNSLEFTKGNFEKEVGIADANIIFVL